MHFGLLAVVLAAALLLGGGTRSGFLGDVAVQLMAVPLLIFGARNWIARMANDKLWRTDHLFLNLAFIASISLVFVPLARGPDEVGAFTDGNGSPLRPLFDGVSTTVPWTSGVAGSAASWAAVASAIPFFAVFLGTAHLSQRNRAKLGMLAVALGGLSLLIGFLQVNQGVESDLRFYAVTNPSEAVGFFANRNHFAALLYVTLVFTAVLLAGLGGTPRQITTLNKRHSLFLIPAAILLFAILSGIALARSRAGMALSLVAMIGIFALYWPLARGSGRNATVRRVLIAAAACGMIFAIQFGMQRAMTRFEADPFSDLRLSLSPATVALALQNLPFGTGLGSFEQTYAIAEADPNLFSGYANRAHNDWAEFLLETGLLGAVAGGLFLIWLAGRAVSFCKASPRDSDILVVLLSRGGCLAIVLLLIHSMVDYPLRTTALSSIFAFAAALMVPPPGSHSGRRLNSTPPC